MSSWEKAVIGTVLSDPAAMAAAEELMPSDFTGPCVPVWAEALGLHNRGALGTRALIEALRNGMDWQRFPDAGTPEEFVQECLTFRGNEIEEYVRQVQDNAVKRGLVNGAALIAAEARREGVPAEEVLDFAEQQIMRLRRNRGIEGVTLEDLTAVFLPRMDDQREGRFIPAWEPGLTAVRDIVKFVEKTEYVIIAARPGEGKSSYLRYEARKFCRPGNHVTIINLENDNLEYVRNFLSLESGIDSAKLKDARLLSPEELERARQAAEIVRRLPIRIVDMPGKGIAEITRRMRRSITEDRTNLIMLDYVQLVSNGMDNKNADLTLTSQCLRSFALSNGVPVVTAAQLSRDIERRNNGDSEPQLSDLRDSGSLEQDATIVMFPRVAWTNPSADEMAQFPENVDPRTRRIYPRPKAVPVRFYVKKNRNGEIGASDLVKWTKSTGNYQTLQMP